LRRKRKAGEREQCERGISNIHYCLHGFISFHYSPPEFLAKISKNVPGHPFPSSVAGL
jgi:hypothetical protein